MKYLFLYILQVYFMLACRPAESQITRIWLTHASDDPSSIVINWYSKQPGNSEVYFRAGEDKEVRLFHNGSSVLHHVEIPLKQKDVMYHYRVKTGAEQSRVYSFKGYPSDAKQLRVAVVGNWGYADSLDLSRLTSDDPHLLLTLGDNIPNLHELCGEGVKDCIEPYLRLIDSYPDLFHSIPFMPILGNHDKEVRPRGTKYPPLAVYDTTATVYREFFALPGDEWKWNFSVPEFNVGFIALDLNHTGDYGTTWQTCHSFHRGSEQFNWYKNIMDKNTARYVVTLHNEQNMRMRSEGNNEWQRLFQKGTMLISGYGYFYEYANVDGFPYFTTSLKAGDSYPDKYSKVIRPVAGYMLLTFHNGKSAKVEIKSLDNKITEVYNFNGH